MNERHKVVLALINIIMKDNKVLMLLRKNKFDAGLYSLPGGCLEKMENAQQNGAREIKEETNLDVDPQDVKIISAIYKNTEDWQSIELVSLVDKFSGELKNMEPDKSKKMEWFDINNLPENISDYAKLAINNFKNNVVFSETKV